MKKRIKLKCDVCGNFQSRELSNDAIIVKNNKILLIKRANDPYKDLWALPGGMVDFDETVEESVIREVSEETGLVVTDLNLSGIYSNPARHPKQTVAIAYIIKVKGSPKAGDDASECHYFPFKELPKPLAFDHELIIKDYLQRNL